MKNKLNPIKKTGFRWIPLASLLMVVLTSGCYRVPEVYEDDDILVATVHDKKADFKELSTFAIVDTIGVISDDSNDKPIYDNDAVAVLNNIAAQFKSRGFTEVDKSQTPDFAVNVSSIKTLNVVSYYPGYWYGYGGYYGGSYWGYPGYGYYYPYSYTYTYTTGSLLIETIDLKHSDVNAQHLTVIWFCILNGYADTKIGSAKINSYVDKGFKQSPYIQAN